MHYEFWEVVNFFLGYILLLFPLVALVWLIRLHNKIKALEDTAKDLRRKLDGEDRIE